MHCPPEDWGNLISQALDATLPLYVCMYASDIENRAYNGKIRVVLKYDTATMDKRFQ